VPSVLSRACLLALLLLAAPYARADGEAGIAALERFDLPLERNAAASLEGKLTLAYLADAGWLREEILAGAAQAAHILGQCGVAFERAELVRLAAPARYLDFSTAASRDLARALPLARPAIYFVAGTRQRPAFDAEAIGRGNSRSRPELADSVWVTRGTRDLGVALAHELAHVLMDSGEHSTQAGNLMREDTAPANTRLSTAQCERLRQVGATNGMLKTR
jgi:hypothetical protein